MHEYPKSTYPSVATVPSPFTVRDMLEDEEEDGEEDKEEDKEEDGEEDKEEDEEEDEDEECRKEKDIIPVFQHIIPIATIAIIIIVHKKGLLLYHDGGCCGVYNIIVYP